MDSDTGLKRGAPILVVLHSPREKCWGMLDEITAAGVFLRGLDLKSFDDWVRSVVHREPFIGFGSLFFPSGVWNESPEMNRLVKFRRFINRLSTEPG